MTRALVCLLSLCGLLGACASGPPPGPPPDGLFDDARFAPPTERVDAEQVFAVSEAMQRYLREDMAPLLRRHGRQYGLIEALGNRAQLRLEYDAVSTRTASQAFEARSGNCLALVVMTAAFAKELGVPVTYQSAYVDEPWSRSGDLYVRSGHVNLTLGRRAFDVGTRHDRSEATVDFLPPGDLKGLRTRPIGEATVLAMFMNNRAVEALVQGRIDDAYWWTREALRAEPGHWASYNTLGVIWLRRGDAERADRVLAYLLEQQPEHLQALANRALALERGGQDVAAAALRGRLSRHEPHPPFHFFHLGQAAMERGDFAQARELFARELRRDPYYHEFHFWLGQAHWRLGDAAQARKHLALAADYSTTRRDRALYDAKLAWLRAAHH